jgi:UDP-2,3-diacylglucosamine hydrolase
VTESADLKGYFLSDLHLFSRRSTGETLMPELEDKVQRSHTVVLGGDIFDFKWSTEGPADATCQRASRWLADLLSLNGECEFHYILGNHDSNPMFVECLKQLAEDHPLFFWHRYFARLDHCLFLHGDIADGSLDHSELDSRRAKLEGKHRKFPGWHFAYDVAIHARLHRLAILSIRELVVLRRVREYAEQIGHGVEAGITDVYFGHTHMDLDGVEHRGLRFHNGGAAIRGLPFRIIETTLESPACVRA